MLTEGPQPSSSAVQKTRQLPVSVFVITKNEEARLGRTLTAIQHIAGEIVVVDSGSEDRTVEIAESFGARVIRQAWLGYGPQKRFAEERCRHDWLFNIDADEVVTEQLAAELLQLFRDEPPAPGAFRVRIRTVYPGEDRPRRFARTFNVVRLYHKNVARYHDHPTYDRVVINGLAPLQLDNSIHHFQFLSLSHLVDKLNSLTDFQVKNDSKKRSTLTKFRLFTELPVAFIKSYFFRGHFLGGTKGFAFALSESFMRALRVAKILERNYR